MRVLACAELKKQVNDFAPNNVSHKKVFCILKFYSIFKQGRMRKKMDTQFNTGLRKNYINYYKNVFSCSLLRSPSGLLRLVRFFFCRSPLWVSFLFVYIHAAKCIESFIQSDIHGIEIGNRNILVYLEGDAILFISLKSFFFRIVQGLRELKIL